MEDGVNRSAGIAGNARLAACGCFKKGDAEAFNVNRPIWRLGMTNRSAAE